MSKKIPHQNLEKKKVSKIAHLRKIQRENGWVKNVTSPKSKGKKCEQKNSPQKNPRRKCVKKNTSPKSKGKNNEQNNSPQKNPERKYVGKKNTSPKSKLKKIEDTKKTEVWESKSLPFHWWFFLPFFWPSPKLSTIQKKKREALLAYHFVGFLFSRNFFWETTTSTLAKKINPA